MPKKMSARIRWITRSQWIAEKNWPVGAPCRGRGEWFCTTDPLDSNQIIIHPVLSRHAGIDQSRWATCHLYPDLSQYPANRAQTVQIEPNGVFSFQPFTSEPERNHPFFAKPF